MSQLFRIHPDNPQDRLIKQAVEILRNGGLIVYPTDAAYAVGCRLTNKKAIERIRLIRCVEQDNDFALVCRDLSEVAIYAQVTNAVFRSIKVGTPGAYTFILPATREVPKGLIDAKRRTIGIRVPDNNICRALLNSLGEPILSTTLILPGDEYPLSDPSEIRDVMPQQTDLIIDGGFCGLELTTVVSFAEDAPEVIRAGMGDVALFG